MPKNGQDTQPIKDAFASIAVASSHASRADWCSAYIHLGAAFDRLEGCEGDHPIADGIACLMKECEERDPKGIARLKKQSPQGGE
ncbi:MAG: hypothetical protein ACYTFI_15080 [Planctomycetota bacterium]|jgi:hypothetical protein